MQFTIATIAAFSALVSAQNLNIPTRSGNIISLPKPSVISGSVDFKNQEFDRGRDCNSDDDTGSDSAVFILENGASISNVIIGPRQLEGIHCKGACTLTNVWFRDVCEDAISALGNGNVNIIGGGAQEAKDKVVQHNGRGTVTIKNYTVKNVGKLYRSCGNCSNNGGPRKVVIDNVKAYGVTSDLAGINSNFGDTATITNSCGNTKKTCQEYKGVQKGQGESPKQSTTGACLGAQGKLAKLPTC